MFYRIKDELADCLQARLAEAFGVSREQYRIQVQYPARLEFGDFGVSFPFELAKVLRRSPQQIAQQFLDGFRAPAYVRRIDTAGGGYINFAVDRWSLFLDAVRALRSGRLWPEFEPDAGKTIVEHTNINPNKAAHIGHLRNAILGDSLVRLLRFNGKRVEVQNYIDNTGVQVADVVVGFLHLEHQGVAEVAAIEGRFDYLCWDLYARVARFYEASETNARLRGEVLHQIEAGDNAVAELADLIATRIVNCHLDTMERLDIRYDVLPRESDILHLHFWDTAFAQLKARGAAELETAGPNAGCWIMRYQKDGQEDTKILVRSNGTVTYTGKDIAYQLWKIGRLDKDFHYEPFRAYDDGHTVWASSSAPATVDASDLQPPRFGAGDRVFNVIDARQAYTQNVVFEGLRRLGYTDEAERSVHFAYEIVALSPRCAQELGSELSDEDRQRAHVEVSGRKGLGVKADDLLDRLEEKARREVDVRNPDMAPDQAARTARDIAIGALRYFMVRYSRKALIVFDFDDALNFDGETGPYLQYSAVRARNIGVKYREHYGLGEAEAAAALDGLLAAAAVELPDDVWDLLTQALKLRDAARASLAGQELAAFAKYLYTLAQRFSNFYNKHRIIGEEDPVWRLVFLAVVHIYYQGMQQGLDILGIPIPERM